jgi:hypothetical protein
MTVLGLLGVVLAIAGVALFNDEVALLRLGTDGELRGATCGAPLDNPGWRTGSSCHGAVNRQTALAAVVLVNGVALTIIATMMIVAGFKCPRPRSTNQDRAPRPPR